MSKKNPVSLRDLGHQIAEAEAANVYTHVVMTREGSQLAIARSLEEAETIATRVGKGVTVEPYTPTPSTYWTTGEPHYDH